MLLGGDGEGSVGGDIFFHTEKWGLPAALSALLFLFGVFSFSGKYLFVRSLIRFIGFLNLGMNG